MFFLSRLHSNILMTKVVLLNVTMMVNLPIKNMNHEKLT